MRDNQHINLSILEEVASALGEINKEVIYVGGAVISLYASNYNSEEVRPTKDIDITVKVSTYAQMDELRERLTIGEFAHSIMFNSLSAFFS
jgi:predicted nucleotidyltransferase